ncbi:Structural maintenance of chromosomes protein 5 [Polyrhizophydium stewartii]|uniref:Structural maintenance of chromosomes protein 5 n=1 Tax=Polyrhizophydium stewartii TaxID=2732419 RepID=A0ABR4MW41_9FUNG
MDVVSSQDTQAPAGTQQPSRATKKRRTAAAAAKYGPVLYPDHLVGSIVRIKLTNFLTYSHAEFFPGPSLNMVMGPNGTGKSTVVCAIALGLGGKPDVLGRARELQDFVKHGEDKAVIEIELKGPDNRPIVIARSFERGTNQSSWKLGDRPAKERDIRAEIDSLNIQVDNLWFVLTSRLERWSQFLPQDRVAGFAQMSASELLRETERAVGGREMVEWHEFLIEQREKEVGVQNSLKDTRSKLDVLRKRNQALEADVQRVKERDQIKGQIRLLTARAASLDYEAKRAKYLEAKDQRDNLKKELDSLRALEQPLRVRLANAESDVRDFDQQAQKEKTKFAAESAKISRFMSESTEKAAEADRIRESMAAAERDKARRVKELEKKEREVQGIRDELKDLARKLADYDVIVSADEHAVDLADSGSYLVGLAKQIDECSTRLDANINRMTELRGSRDDLQRQADGVRHQLARKESELAQFDSIQQSKLRALRDFNLDCYNATMWLRENRSQFKMHIFDPICLEINLKDPKYASCVETIIKHRNMTTFVTQCQEDYQMFCRIAIDKHNWRINAVCFDKELSSWRPTVPRSRIAEIGFDFYALDLLEGPEQPVALGRLRLLDDAEREFRLFIAENNMFTVKQAYGQKSTRAAPLTQPRFLVKSVDSEAKERLEADVEALRSELSDIENRVKAVHIDSNKLKKIDDEIREEKTRLLNARSTVVGLKKNYNTTCSKLRRFERDLQERRDIVEQDRNSVPESHEKLIIVCRERAVNARRLQRAYTASSVSFQRRTLAQLNSMQAQVEFDQVQEEIRARSERSTDLEKEFESAKEELKRLKNSARDALDKLEQAMALLTPEEADELREFEETLSEEEVLAQIAALETQANIIAGIDPNIVKEYDERTKEIEDLERTAANFETIANELQERMQSTKERWTGTLRGIVGRLSESFSESLESEVCIDENDDYAKWGIQIRVKFRDSENLQALTATRQSGGTMSKSPFRVVDEINQGMDPRNERMIHRLIVKAACGGETSQYFLITPKLLHDLEYHERMKVLCVFNGPWQSPAIDLAAIVRRKLGRKA